MLVYEALQPQNYTSALMSIMMVPIISVLPRIEKGHGAA